MCQLIRTSILALVIIPLFMSDPNESFLTVTSTTDSGNKTGFITNCNTVLTDRTKSTRANLILINKNPYKNTSVRGGSRTWRPILPGKVKSCGIGRAQSVQQLATGQTVRRLNPVGRQDFPRLSKPALGPTQPPIKWMHGYCQGYSSRGRISCLPVCYPKT
jgi:hypothetical protein